MGQEQKGDLLPTLFLSPHFRAARTWKTPLRYPNFVHFVRERLLRRLPGSSIQNLCSRAACQVLKTATAHLPLYCGNRATNYLPSKEWRPLSNIEYVPSTSSLVDFPWGWHNFTNLPPWQAHLLHLSIKMTTPHQSGAPFVGERVFQSRGVCGQALPSFSSPTPPFTFLLSSHFSRGPNAKTPLICAARISFASYANACYPVWGKRNIMVVSKIKKLVKTK